MLRSKETKLTFSYGINPRTTVTIGTNGASVTWSNGTITSNTGATPPQSFAGLQGTMPVIFAGTENVSAIFTASFSSTPVAGTTSVVGFGDTEYGIFVGYNGTQQGVCLAQNGLAQYYLLSLSGSVTVAGTLTLTLNGVTYAISIPVGLAVQDVINLLQTSTAIASGNYFVRQFGMGVHIWSIAAQTRERTAEREPHRRDRHDSLYLSATERSIRNAKLDLFQSMEWCSQFHNPDQLVCDEHI